VGSQYTAPTYRKTADAVKTDNTKAEGVIKLLYRGISMFAQRKLGTALMESVLVQNSKSGLEELGATAVEPRSRVCPHP